MNLPNPNLDQPMPQQLTIGPFTIIPFAKWIIVNNLDLFQTNLVKPLFAKFVTLYVFFTCVYDCLFCYCVFNVQIVRRATFFCEEIEISSPTSKASGTFIKFLSILSMHDQYIFLSMCRSQQNCYAKTIQNSTPILVGLESYYNMVDLLSYANDESFTKC